MNCAGTSSRLWRKQAVVAMSSENLSINLSLVSHTNVGKTTLARTLLKKDIGEIGDRPHVTALPEPHLLIRDCHRLRSPSGIRRVLVTVSGLPSA